MPKKALQLLLFLLNGLIASAQKFPDNILFKSYAEQYHYRDSIAHTLPYIADLSTTLAALQQLTKWAEEKDDIPLKFGVETSELQLRADNHIIGQKDYENAASNLLSKIKYNKFSLLEAELLGNAANFHWQEKNYVPAFEYSIKAYNIYSSITEQEFPEKGAFTAGFGGMYYYFKDFNTAKRYHLEAVTADRFSNLSMINTLGLCYVNLGVYDSAKYIFDTAYQIAEKRNDTSWRGLLSGNIGYLYYCLGQYDKAIPLLENEVRLWVDEKKGDHNNAATSLALLSTIFMEKNDRAQALSLAQQAYQTATDWKTPLSFSMQKNIYAALAKAYAANGQSALAYAYLDSATQAKDTIAKNTNLLVLAGAQNVIDADKHLAEIQKFEHEQRMHNLIRNGLITGIVLLAVIGILLIRYQRHKFLTTRKRLETEKLLAETELKNAFSQLNIFTQSISEKNELIEKFTAEMNRMQKMIDPSLTYQTETIAQLQQATILTDNQWDDFQHLFEKAHKGFLKRLNHKMHGLSPIDVRFMLLCKLRLSAGEMAGTIGISKDAVLQNLERLRHKLNLHHQNITLEDFADTI